jgi:hypothetical protein
MPGGARTGSGYHSFLHFLLVWFMGWNASRCASELGRKKPEPGLNILHLESVFFMFAHASR